MPQLKDSADPRVRQGEQVTEETKRNANTFKIGLTGQPIRDCGKCGFATDKPEIEKCPNDGRKLRGRK